MNAMPSPSARIAIRASGFSFKARRTFLLKLLLTFVILSWLIHYLRSHDLLAIFRHVRLSAIALAASLLPLNLGLQFLKWHYLLRCGAARRCPPRAALFSLLAGFPLGLLTPGRWGELGRAFFLPQMVSHKIFLLAALDKGFDLLLTMLAGTSALLFFIHKNFIPAAWLPAVLLLMSIIFVLNILALQPGILRKSARVLGKTHGVTMNVMRSANRFTRRQLATVWLLSASFVATFSLQFALLLRGFVEVSFLEAMTGAAAVFFAKSLLPIALGDLGVREGAAAFFFARMNVLPQAAFNASLLLFVINLLTPSLIGMWLIWKSKKNDS